MLIKTERLRRDHFNEVNNEEIITVLLLILGYFFSMNSNIKFSKRSNKEAINGIIQRYK